MIVIVIGIVAGVLIALDAARTLRAGVAKTTFGTFSRAERPDAFRVVVAAKLLMTVLLFALASLLIVRSAQ